MTASPPARRRPHHYTPGVELEIKLVEVAPDTLTASSILEAAHTLGTVSNVRELHLRARYHRHRTLDAVGWTLRCRHDGETITATAKGPGPLVAGLRSRAEHETALNRIAEPGDLLPPELDAVLPLRRWPRLGFETDMHRTVADLAVPGGTMELAFDRGHVASEGHRKALRELEVELKSGAPEVVRVTARALARTLPVRPGARSKAAWGALLSGTLRPYEVPADDAEAPRLWEAYCELLDRVRDEDGPAWASELDRVSALLRVTDDPWSPLDRL